MSDQGANDRLRLLIERVERFEGDKADIAEDIKAVYGEAKAVGFDVKIMRELVRLRKMKPDDLRERNALLQVYASELGLDLL